MHEHKSVLMREWLIQHHYHLFQFAYCISFIAFFDQNVLINLRKKIVSVTKLWLCSSVQSRTKKYLSTLSPTLLLYSKSPLWITFSLVEESQRCLGAVVRHADSKRRDCESKSCTCHNKNAMREEANGKTPHKIHLPRKKLRALSLVSATLKIEYARKFVL